MAVRFSLSRTVEGLTALNGRYSAHRLFLKNCRISPRICHLCERQQSTNSQGLEGRTALVTGCTSGIGLGIAHGLANQGCSIIITGLGDENLTSQLTKDFNKQYKCRTEYIAADFTSPAELQALCSSARDVFPDGIDILVNNAGFQFVSPIEYFPPDKWDALIAVMLSAPYHLIRHLLPAMKNKGYGRIINLSSVHGVRASPNKCAYVSAKHGIVGLTKVVALETAGTGVTCNAICPGYVDTPILQMQVKKLSEDKNISYEKAKEEFLSRFHPSKEPVGIHHIAEMCVFMCSEAGSQMTGSSIIMDGGWSAK